jgi:carbon dioxide concentrating mechanism protein CcmL
MLIGKVIGNVVSVAKVPGLLPVKLYVLRVYDYEFKPTEKFEVAVDAVGAGIGDYVLYCGGSAARIATLTNSEIPTDISIIARIDSFDELRGI